MPRLSIIFNITLLCFAFSAVGETITPTSASATTNLSSNDADQALQKANILYESGDKEQARKLYIIAANNGSAEAHFLLAFQYRVNIEDAIYHYSEAAKQGHQQALGSALDYLFFQANSLELANPQGALALYEQAKKANPSLELFYEERKIRVLKMSVEAGEFDGKKFIEQYNIKVDNDNNRYSIWEIAEEASRGGRFGPPDPKLLLQIVARGGAAPAELMLAIKTCYENWQNNVVKEFDICDYITSGIGASFCARRGGKFTEGQLSNRLEKLSYKLKKKERLLLNKAYKAACDFFNLKAGNEEGHGGTLIGAFIIGSRVKQKQDYIKLVEKVRGNFKPKLRDTCFKTDQKLNDTYQRIIKTGTENKQISSSDSPTPEEIRQVQRSWLIYRDASARLFSAINPLFTLEEWGCWLTEIRESQLNSISFY